MNIQKQLLNRKREHKFTSEQVKEKSQLRKEELNSILKNNFLTRRVKFIMKGISYGKNIVAKKKYETQTNKIIQNIPSTFKSYAYTGKEFAEFYRFNETENMELKYGSIEKFLDQRGLKIKKYLEGIGFKVKLKQDKTESHSYCAIRVYFEEQTKK